MKVRLKIGHLRTPEGRKMIAEFVAGTVNRREYPDIPYCPNQHDDSFWTVDTGNDWKIQFFDEDPFVFEIVHRYKETVAINALAGWIAWRLGGTTET